MKKVLFLTGTRADYGKLVSLVKGIDAHPDFVSYVYVTGMHTMEKFGYTAKEVIDNNHNNIVLSSNQTGTERSEVILANTIQDFSKHVEEVQPDLIVIHGDRIEALAGAIVGALSNVLVAHIEGGESSGSIDESIRHSISKLSHTHFVANDASAKKLESMGEWEHTIYNIGSPDFDLILNRDLSDVEPIKAKYDIPFEEYGIFIFHSVTTEISIFEEYCKEVVQGLADSEKKFILICPNNDPGSQLIFADLNKILAADETNERFRRFPSIPFEDFLVLLKNAKCIVGNSSAGVRQAPVLAVPTINIGTRQNGRNSWVSIYDLDYDAQQITQKIHDIWASKESYPRCLAFGDGSASKRFIEALESDSFWKTSVQK